MTASSDETLGPARRGGRGAHGDDPGPGDLVASYVVSRVLGRGGGGVVLAAHDPSLDRDVAIKLVRSGFLEEAQALARLSHPNVVQVFEGGTWGDRIFICMELVDGLDLEAWAEAEPRTRNAIIAAYLAVGRGLAAAHAAGLEHGDVKPRNAVMGRDGRVRLIDFGLARTSAPRGIEGGAGTPRYMAPEVAAGAAADAAADQYSFCVALHEALTGERPVDGRPARELSPWLARILRRGLARDPRDRFASMDELIDELGRDRAGRWRRAAAAFGIATVASLVTWIALTATGGVDREPACPDTAARGGGVVAEREDRAAAGGHGGDGDEPAQDAVAVVGLDEAVLAIDPVE